MYAISLISCPRRNYHVPTHYLSRYPSPNPNAWVLHTCDLVANVDTCICGWKFNFDLLSVNALGAKHLIISQRIYSHLEPRVY